MNIPKYFKALSIIIVPCKPFIQLKTNIRAQGILLIDFNSHNLVQELGMCNQSLLFVLFDLIIAFFSKTMNKDPTCNQILCMF